MTPSVHRPQRGEQVQRRRRPHVRWPVIDFGELTASLYACSPNTCLSATRLGRVVARRARAVRRRRSRSSSGREPRVGERHLHRQRHAAAVGRRVGHPVGVHARAVARDLAVDPRAARTRRLERPRAPAITAPSPSTKPERSLSNGREARSGSSAWSFVERAEQRRSRSRRTRSSARRSRRPSSPSRRPPGRAGTPRRARARRRCRPCETLNIGPSALARLPIVAAVTFWSRSSTSDGPVARELAARRTGLDRPRHVDELLQVGAADAAGHRHAALVRLVDAVLEPGVGERLERGGDAEARRAREVPARAGVGHALGEVEVLDHPRDLHRERLGVERRRSGGRRCGRRPAPARSTPRRCRPA